MKSEKPEWNDSLFRETLETLVISRAGYLMSEGVEYDVARLIALLETEKRKKLARDVGAYAAIAASAEIVDSEDFGVSLKLSLDRVPYDVGCRFIFDFEADWLAGEAEAMLTKQLDMKKFGRGRWKLH